MDIQTRFQQAEFLMEHYADFSDFLIDGMQFLGYNASELQLDIGDYMVSGPRLSMVQAFRGAAKSTIAMLYVIWCIIQRPSTIALMVSSGQTFVAKLSAGIVRILMHWDILACYRPDRYEGDSVSISAFDIHYSLKGVNKSPSISCLSVRTGLAGNRADIIVADDIEIDDILASPKLRERVSNAMKEFSAICITGKILYLGTPHTADSDYNKLPGMGYDVRVWPARYPTPAQLATYKGNLAPYIQQKIDTDPTLQLGGGMDGSMGQSTEPSRFTELVLDEKLMAYLPAGFQLQYMLDVSLSDAEKRQLNLRDLVVANFGADSLPERIGYQAVPQQQVELPSTFPVHNVKMYYALPIQSKYGKPTDVCMVIDPASDHGKDEMGYAVGTFYGDAVHVFDCGGIRGGLSAKGVEHLCTVARENNVTRILCESNMGHGTFESSLRAVLRDNNLKALSESVTGLYSTGQKEKRIIDSILPALHRHKLVVHQKVFQSDEYCCNLHNSNERRIYSLWYQFENITTDRKCLKAYDRLDAMAILVQQYSNVFSIDVSVAAKQREQDALQEFLQNPMSYTDSSFKQRRSGSTTRARLMNR